MAKCTIKRTIKQPKSGPENRHPKDPRGSFSHRGEGIAWRGAKAHKAFAGMRSHWFTSGITRRLWRSTRESARASLGVPD